MEVFKERLEMALSADTVVSGHGLGSLISKVFSDFIDSVAEV